MARKRQIVLLSGKPKASDAAPMPPLGSRKDVRDVLARYNTAPDGSGRNPTGTEILHGPGMFVELPTAMDSVAQAMVTVLDDDIAWPVLSRVCKAQGWRMMDLESGRYFM